MFLSLFYIFPLPCDPQKLASQFLSSSITVEAFLDAFTKMRRDTHVKRVKVDKLKELLRNRRISTASSSSSSLVTSPGGGGGQPYPSRMAPPPPPVSPQATPGMPPYPVHLPPGAVPVFPSIPYRPSF